MEGLVGYARRNFMVPAPRAASWEELNARLLEGCRKRRERKLWGHHETIEERFKRDQEKLLPLPPAPLEACQQRTTRASSQALVRFETNDYSVPVEYGHRQVLLKAFVWEIAISCSSEVIARHPRSYGRERDDLQSAAPSGAIGAQDQCAGSGRAPAGLATARRVRRTAAPDGSAAGQTRPAGIRASVAAAVAAGVRQALRWRAIAFDAVKHLVLCAIERRPAQAGSGKLSASAAGRSSVTRAAGYQVLLAEPVR